MLSTVLNAFFILRTECFQLLCGVLGAVDTEDDGESSVSAVQSTDPADKAVVQGGILCIAVLLALDGFMVWCACGMS